MPNEKLRDLVKTLYRNREGEPLTLSDGQLSIFEAIVKRDYSFWHVMTSTQYGKSDTAGTAVLTVVSNYPEKFAIIAGKKDKAQIIMDYVISHIFDNELTRSRFVVEAGESAENIRRRRNKQHLTFDVGNGQLGEVFIGSAKDALGFGAPNVIVDEAAFVDDREFALVLRMLAGQKNIFLMKIGNPYFRNHFLKSYRDPSYKQIVIDHHQGLKEGRLNPAIVQKAQDEADFDVLYACKFPEESAIDEHGYSILLTESELDRAYLEKPMQPIGWPTIGFDVASGGRNYSTIVIRWENIAMLLWRERTEDTMIVATMVSSFAKQFNVSSYSIAGDDIGAGKGACDRLAEMLGVYPGINVGNKPTDEYSVEMAINPKERYINLRAQKYFEMAHWVRKGGKLIGKGKWEEILEMRWKLQSDRKIKMKGKDEMRDEGIESPDVADALMLSFTKKGQPPYQVQSDNNAQVDSGGVFPKIT
jgi:hypothetical protein